jgi:hypothetical protein
MGFWLSVQQRTLLCLALFYNRIPDMGERHAGKMRANVQHGGKAGCALTCVRDAFEATRNL